MLAGSAIETLRAVHPKIISLVSVASLFPAPRTGCPLCVSCIEMAGSVAVARPVAVLTLAWAVSALGLSLLRRLWSRRAFDGLDSVVSFSARLIAGRNLAAAPSAWRPGETRVCACWHHQQPAVERHALPAAANCASTASTLLQHHVQTSQREKMLMCVTPWQPCWLAKWRWRKWLSG